MSLNQAIRENIDRMEDHEVVHRLRSNMFSDEAEIYARGLLAARGIDFSSDQSEIEDTEDDSPGLFWPLWFGLTIGTLLGASVGATLGGAIGAGLGAAGTIWGVTAIVKRGVATLYTLTSSKAVRVAALVFLWLVTAWLAGAVGFVLKHAP